MTGSADVTCVIPTHGRDHYLDEAIASVVAQDYQPAALVVSDDMGAASTRELVQSWAGRAAFPVRYLDSSGPGAGTAGASRNAGAALVTSELLAFLDDDDLWAPGFLRQVVETLVDSGSDFAVGWTSSDTSGFSFARIEPGLAVADVVARNPGFVGSNFVMRRAAFESLGGFDPALTVSNDKDFLVRALQSGLRYQVVREVLVLNRIHGRGQLTDKTESRVAGIQRYMDKHAALLSPRDRRYLRTQILSIRRVTAPSAPRRLWFSAALALDRSVYALTAQH